MKKLFKIIAVTAISSLSIVPTLAAAEGMDPKTVTCKQFSAMDAAGMATAIEAMHKASPDAAMAMDAAAVKTATESTVTACKGAPDMMAMDAMMKK